MLVFDPEVVFLFGPRYGKWGLALSMLMCYIDILKTGRVRFSWLLRQVFIETRAQV